MRINKFVAQATGLSRRVADAAIAKGRVGVNGKPAANGHEVHPNDVVTLGGRRLALATFTTIMLNKPVGYVCSRNGQGSKTIYDLLPPDLHHLKPVGRLDKDSSGLLLLTNNGDLANRLTHPSFQKQKIYEIKLDKSLTPADLAKINQGVRLDDGISHLILEATRGSSKSLTPTYKIRMAEGKNRQIRRTLKALGYTVISLHRTQFGPYTLTNIAIGKFRHI
jgi:23S rRNA pseudouridine2605 synthase